MIHADFDNDGDPDLLVTHMTAAPTLYRNDSQSAAWLGLDLVGNSKTCARNAYHSKVIAYPANQPPIAREVYANNGLAAQSDRRILFGLGSLKTSEASFSEAKTSATSFSEAKTSATSASEAKTQKIRIQIQWCGHGKAQEMELATGRYHRLEQP